MIETLLPGAVLTVLTVGLLANLGACTPEATAPQGGAAVARVVPVVVPDAWCTTRPDKGQDSTASAKDPAHPTCDAPNRPKAGNGSLKPVVDSAVARPDTTK
jgi:hypothetical protein